MKNTNIEERPIFVIKFSVEVPFIRLLYSDFTLFNKVNIKTSSSLLDLNPSIFFLSLPKKVTTLKVLSQCLSGSGCSKDQENYD